MTESDWLRGDDPAAMLTYLGRDPVDRRFRLFVCACCRRFLDQFDYPGILEAVRSAELYADGGIAPAMLELDLAAVDEGRGEYCENLNHIAEAVHLALRPQRMLPYDAALAAQQVMAAFEVGSLEFDALEERAEQCALLRDVVGNPFRPVAFDPAWRSANVRALAAAIYADSAYDRLPILGDALEEAGCTRSDVLEHCREPAEHVRGCWVIDGLLEK